MGEGAENAQGHSLTIATMGTWTDCRQRSQRVASGCAERFAIDADTLMVLGSGHDQWYVPPTESR
jgi:hypothetical protein